MAKLPPPASRVRVKTESGSHEGLVMPSEGENLVLKLDSGYNIGINPKTITDLEVLVEPKKMGENKKIQVTKDKSLPDVLILHTGGTIASKVDYETGAVISRSTPEEILASVPELKSIANIHAETIFQMFSEDILPVHWGLLAKAVADNISKYKGIIVAMGTDTLEYVASALSFALVNCPIPVLVVGSQRSSDRPSSDASMNLLCATHFIAETDFAGVGVCLHENMNDNNCLVIEGHHVKKMHTSRRDTFRPVNKRPIARISMDGKLELIRKDYAKATGKFELKEKFSSKVGLVKIYPGFIAEQLDWFEKNCEALLIEGYAFGQLPVIKWDEYTAHHPKLLEKVRKIAEKMPVFIASQRPYGIPHMHVYSNSRELLNAGALPAKMQAHVAYVKLCHVMANYDDVASALKQDLSGEIVDRSEEDTFLK